MRIDARDSFSILIQSVLGRRGFRESSGYQVLLSSVGGALKLDINV